MRSKRQKISNAKNDTLDEEEKFCRYIKQNGIPSCFSMSVILRHVKNTTKIKTLCKCLEIILILLKFAILLPDKVLYKRICMEYHHGVHVHPHYKKSAKSLLIYNEISRLVEPSLLSVCKSTLINTSK